MIPVLLALAGLALDAPAFARTAETGEAPSMSVTASALPRLHSPEDERPEAVTRLTQWIADSDDNGALPYVVVDKSTATLFLFNSKGETIGETPVLIGVAVGDVATPGIGSKNLAEVGPAERTTPAGRFLARYGRAVGRQRVLWVDYGTSVAIHPVITGNKKERRRERLLSDTPDDNRITFGCINVPVAFYQKKVRTLLRRKGGVVYVLPDTRAMEDVFPRMRVRS